MLTTLTKHLKHLAVRFPHFCLALGTEQAPYFSSHFSIVIESRRGRDQPHRRFATMFD